MIQNCLKKLNWDFKIYEGCFLWFYADIKSAFLKESTVFKLNFKNRRTSMVSRTFEYLLTSIVSIHMHTLKLE